LSSALSQLSKSTIAFIRHGHGEDTIDEYGEWSEDDGRRREYEQAREQRKVSIRKLFANLGG